MTRILQAPAMPVPSSAAFSLSIFGITDLYVSGGAEHQGPPGGGPVAIIVEKEQ